MTKEELAAGQAAWIAENPWAVCKHPRWSATWEKGDLFVRFITEVKCLDCGWIEDFHGLVIGRLRVRQI